MGCHTWVYKKVSALTEKEKNDIKKEALDEVKEWWGFKVSEKAFEREIFKWFKEDPKLFDKKKLGEPKEYAKRVKKKYQDDLNKLEKGEFKETLEYRRKMSGCEVRKYNNEDYYAIDFDNPFRLYGYPEDTFTRKEELLEYLKNYNPLSVGYYDKDDDYKFKEGYTEELVKRIEDYFKLHGEDNLYFMFG